jgi:hypothetical protein
LIVNDLWPGERLGQFTATFNALLGGGTSPPADGMAFSVANDLPNGTFGEEGAGHGLSVCFDSFDNGGGEAPAIDVKWNDIVIAHTMMPSVETGGQFVPVVIQLDPDGTLDVTVAGQPIYADLATGYVPILGARFGIGSRTGGLNENAWIDDLSIVAYPVDASTAEATQTLQFIVTNDKPELFNVQPSVALDGTLTFTPKPGSEGVAIVTVTLKDDGGTAYGGQDSRTRTCTLRVFVNDPPVVATVTAQTPQNTPVLIRATKLLFGAVDPDGNPVTLAGVYNFSAEGGRCVLGPTGITYTPMAGFLGVDTFTYMVDDGYGGRGYGTVVVTVTPGGAGSKNITGVSVAENGDFVLNYAGIPGRTYRVERAGDVNGPWTEIGTATVGANGLGQFVDGDPARPSPAFYRMMPQ